LPISHIWDIFYVTYEVWVGSILQVESIAHTQQPPHQTVRVHPSNTPGSSTPIHSYRDAVASGSGNSGNERRVTWADEVEREGDYGRAAREYGRTEDQLNTRLEAQFQIRERQILLNTKKGGILSKETTGHRAVVETANEALEILEAPEELRGAFTTAMHLRNGTGVLLEARNIEVLDWIRREGRQERFANFMEPGATIKDRTYTITVPYVPITFRPQLDVDLREVEEQNGLRSGEISTARWIKPEDKRAVGQRFAYVALTFSSPDAANMMIKNGISICHRRNYPKKNKKEPIRCMKCQTFGHTGHSCTSPVDICGTCTGTHRTDSCPSYLTKRCANCQSQGHCSWSRECPVFIRKCQELDERTPENHMPYFPTASTWTRVAEPPHRAPPPPPPPNPPPPPPPPNPPPHQPRLETQTQEQPRFTSAEKKKQPMHNFGDGSGLRQMVLEFNTKTNAKKTSATGTEANPVNGNQDEPTTAPHETDKTAESSSTTSTTTSNLAEPEASPTPDERTSPTTSEAEIQEAMVNNNNDTLEQ
jgi:hypothetical protein